MYYKSTLKMAQGTLAVLLLCFSCSQDPNSTGQEYAPQMYNSIAYEPYNQIVDNKEEDFNSNPHNKPLMGTYMNMRKPVQGTISRRFVSGTEGGAIAQDIMVYDIAPDSLNLASRILVNPIKSNEKNLEEGKVLYIRFCAACHGAGGQGDGKVAPMYKGVPAGYNKGRYASLSGGHIFHTITHGKGRMWPHGSQINPDERWKIVLFVQKLQKEK